MTRFARAKGSKASNERVPEEATSWAEMKQQLLERNEEGRDLKKKQEVDKQRSENYKAFLQDVEKEQTKNIKWAEFPTNNGKKLAKNSNGTQGQATSEKNKLSNKAVSEKRGAKRKLDEGEVGGDKKVVEDTSTEVLTKNKQKKLKNGLGLEQKRKKKKIEQETPDNETAVEEKCTKKKSLKVLAKKGGVKKNLNKEKSENDEKTQKVEENLTEEDLKKIEKKKARRQRQLEKRKLRKQESTSDSQPALRKQELTSDSQPALRKQKSTSDSQPVKKKPPKVKDGKQPERRKQFQNRMIINGKEVDIAYVDGFPIKKEDAERIHQLRKQMISKGLPRSEIKITLKLERRKAEKAFAREKKKVCFNCRKSGHNLSDCPELGKELAETSGTGICFKCGSTEHTHFECKVVRGQEFKYAQCFICQEQGHIARQCPDNARGLYPKGGACRVCGDVTHLKKDCPKFQAQQEQLQQSVQIEAMTGDDNPDSLGTRDEPIKMNAPVKLNKIIKF
jgi:zinc finger CCHC domain-containing protein 9